MATPPPLGEQVVVITGASSGIGRCTALLLAERGARVVLTARRAAALESLAAEIASAGGEALAVAGDVTSKPQLEAVARAAIERHGRIDTWVNNAGVYLQGHADGTSLDEYRRVLDVNVIGSINGAQCALAVMRPRAAGTIIQVSSVLGRHGFPQVAAYSAAKAALDGFYDALRAELWGSGIRVAMLYPPTVNTPIFEHGRGKFGTMPKPLPPIEDPHAAAVAIAGLALRPRSTATFGVVGHAWPWLIRLPSGVVDWMLHRAAGFGISDLPAGPDNVETPLDDEPRIRGRWSTAGWKGLTLGEVARVLPRETAVAGTLTALGAVALGARLVRRLRHPATR